MGKRYNIHSKYKNIYLELPKVIMYGEQYKKALCPAAKLLYGLFMDRVSLSERNGWIEESGEPYFKYRVDEMADDLAVSKPTAIKAKQELIDAGLLEQVFLGKNKPNKLYLCEPDITENDIYKIRETENAGSGEKEPSALQQQGSKKSLPPEGSKESLPREVKNLYPNKPYFNKPLKTNKEIKETAPALYSDVPQNIKRVIESMSGTTERARDIWYKVIFSFTDSIFYKSDQTPFIMSVQELCEARPEVDVKIAEKIKFALKEYERGTVKNLDGYLMICVQDVFKELYADYMKEMLYAD